MKKTLLMIGAGPDQLIGILKARTMGLRVVACDSNVNALGKKFTDDFETASVYDKKESLKAAFRLNKRKKIDAVMTLGIDTPIVVSTIAQKLGLFGLPLETAYLATNKYEMKKQFQKFDIPTSWFNAVRSLAHLKRIVEENGYPLVLKPIDSHGARGVLRLTEKVDLKWAYYEALSFSPTKQVMVEEYLFGPQVSTESIIYDNFSATPGFSDRNYEYIEKYTPFMIENGGTLPSRISYINQAAIKRTAEAAARSIGINKWTAKGDMVLTKEGPKVIEITARISGGFFATVKIPYSTGVDLIKAAIIMALGKKPNFENLKVKYQRNITQRYFFSRAGTIKKITGISNLKSTKWVKHFDIWVKEGDVLSEIKHMGSRCGMVIVTGNSKEETIKRVKQAIGMVHFVIDKNEA